MGTAITAKPRVTTRKRANILGVAIDVVDYDRVLRRIDELISTGGAHFVCVNSVQDIMISQDDDTFRHMVNHADVATPDGWPVVWGIRANGYTQRERVTGPDLMLRACEHGVAKGHSHFFYGGAEGVPELLAEKLREKYPGLKVVGNYSPPFRPLTLEEDERIVDMLNSCGADILWVGLGTPKQHYWIKEHLGRVKIPVMIAVGAAFDFHSGRVKRAPKWMRQYWLEWFHRLCHEPRRLWRRYLNYIPRFALKFAAQVIGIRHYTIE